MGEIYNISKGKIEVYSLEPLRGKVITFRQEEFEKLPEDERVLDYIPTKGWFTPRKNIIYECGSHVLRKRNPQPEDEFLMSEFINNNIGAYSLKDITRLDNGREVTTLEPLMYLSSKVLQLTDATTLELLLEQGNYSSKKLQNGNLSSISDLFRLSEKPITVLDLEELKKYFSTNLVPQDELKTKMDKINGSTKVYRKLR